MLVEMVAKIEAYSKL
jgi:hypothetical protein